MKCQTLSNQINTINRAIFIEKEKNVTILLMASIYHFCCAISKNIFMSTIDTNLNKERENGPINICEVMNQSLLVPTDTKTMNINFTSLSDTIIK